MRSSSSHGRKGSPDPPAVAAVHNVWVACGLVDTELDAAAFADAVFGGGWGAVGE